MKKLSSYCAMILFVLGFSACSPDSDGCVTCIESATNNVQTYCEADGDYNGLSESDFIEFQFIAGWTCD